MLPLAAVPDPATFVLPWDAADDDWFVMLESSLDALFQEQGVGRLSRQAMRRRFGTRRKPFKGLGPVVNAHVPMFRPQHSMPCFNLPSRDLLRRLAERPLLEVGAGSGVWGLLVTAAGGDIVATDPRPWPMGHSYDHRDLIQDRTFAERHQAARSHAFSFRINRLVHPYPLASQARDNPFSMSACGPSRMRFRKVARTPLSLRSKPMFHPVLRMTALEAVDAFPGRDILLLSPDPMHDAWVDEFLAALPSGSRVYYVDDFGSWWRPPRGFKVLDEIGIGDSTTTGTLRLLQREPPEKRKSR